MRSIDAFGTCVTG